MRISEDDHRRLAEAIAAAEARTSGEIVLVIAHASSRYADFRLAAAALLALAAPAPLVLFTTLSAHRVYLAALLVFALALGLFGWARARLALVPRAERMRRARRAAHDQFMIREVSRTRGRTGVLIYLSLAERLALILPDLGVAERIAPATWREAIEALRDAAAQGDLVEGCLRAIKVCGGALEAALPAEAENPNERPNEVHLV